MPEERRSRSPPVPIVPCMRLVPKRPETWSGKSLLTDPCPVSASRSPEKLAGSAMVIVPLPVLNDMSLCAASLVMRTSMSPLPDDALTGPGAGVGLHRAIARARGDWATGVLDRDLAVTGTGVHLAGRAGNADRSVPARRGDIRTGAGDIDTSVARARIQAKIARELDREIGEGGFAIAVVATVAHAVWRAGGAIRPSRADQHVAAVGHDVERQVIVMAASVPDLGVYHDPVAGRGGDMNVSVDIDDPQLATGGDRAGPVERFAR